MKRSVIAGIFLLFLIGFTRTAWSAAAADQAANPNAPATYVGNEVCQTCHADQVTSFSETVMGKILLHNPRSLAEKQGCESCHGPGSNHVAAGGGKGVGGLITFRKDSGESAAVQNEACLGCHRHGVQTYWAASPHASRGIACINCHSVMKKTSDRYQLVKVGEKTPFFYKRAETEVCGQCHLQRKAQLLRSSHMPMKEGKITCTDCHNPHGSPNPAQLKQISVNENCYTCHAERRGPFLFEHPPVAENCTNCHEPHGTVNDYLLKVRMPRLCNECHSAHRSNDLATQRGFFNRSCANCHSQIHGSNHPAGMFFQR